MVHQKNVFFEYQTVTPQSAWKVAVCFFYNNSGSGQLEFMSLSKGIPAVTFFHSRRKLSKRTRIFFSSRSKIHTVCWAITKLLRENKTTNSTQLKWRNERSQINIEHIFDLFKTAAELVTNSPASLVAFPSWPPYVQPMNVYIFPLYMQYVCIFLAHSANHCNSSLVCIVMCEMRTNSVSVWTFTSCSKNMESHQSVP